MSADENVVPGASDAWETSKENVGPLKRGRRVDRLQRAFGERGSRGRDLDAQVTTFEEDILGDDGADPLEKWLSYIRFVQEEFPSDRQRAFLLYERCSRALRDRERYRNDVKYMEVWLRYAECLTNPQELFKFLHKNAIGRECAMFWIGWAFFAEHARNYPLADKVFQKAAKCVPPGPARAQVATRQKQFQRRMSRMWLNLAADEAAERGELLPDQELRPVGREALEELAGPRGEHRPRRAEQRPNRENDLVGAAPTQRHSSRRGRGLQSRGNGPAPVAASGNATTQGFQVFVEEDFVAGRTPREEDRAADAATTVLREGRGNGGAVWTDFGREEDRTKENREDASAWNARGGLRSEARRAAGTDDALPRPGPSHLPAIEVFEDEACAAKNEAREKASPDWKRVVDLASRPAMTERASTKELVSEAEILAKDPLHHLRAVPDASATQAAHRDADPERLAHRPLRIRESHESRPAPPRTEEVRERIPAPAASSEDKEAAQAKPQSRMGFDYRLITDANGEEQQFEEARAQKYLVRPRMQDTPGARLPPVTEERSSDSGASQSVLPDSYEPPTSRVSRRLAFGPLLSEAASPQAPRGISTAASISSKLRATARRSLATNSVASADAARSAAHARFEDRVTGSEEASPGPDPAFPSDVRAAEGEDMTINTKLALDELADVFCSPGQTFTNQAALNLSLAGVSAVRGAGPGASFRILPDEEDETGRSSPPAFAIFADEEADGDEVFDENAENRGTLAYAHARRLSDPRAAAAALVDVTDVIVDPEEPAFLHMLGSPASEDERWPEP